MGRKMAMGRQSRSPLRWIVAITFFGFLGLSMPYLIFPPLFLHPSSNLLPAELPESSRALLLGLALAAYPLGQFIGSPLLGSLSDFYSRRKVMGASLFVSGSCNLVTAFSLLGGYIPLLLLSRFLAGLMEGNIAIARAMAFDLHPAVAKHESFGKINAASSIAYLLGPSLGAFLTEEAICTAFGPSTPFFATSLLFIVLAFCCRGLPEKSQEATASALSIVDKWNLAKRIRAHLSDKLVGFLLLISSLFTLFVDLFYEFGPVYLTLEGQLTSVQLLPYSALVSLALALGSGWLAAPVAQRWGAIPSISGSIALFGGLMAIVGIIPVGNGMLVLFGFMGIAIGIGTTNMAVQLSDRADPAYQGEIMGLQSSIRVLGDAFICLLGGLLLSLSAPFLLALAAPVCLAAAYAYQRRMVALRT